MKKNVIPFSCKHVKLKEVLWAFAFYLAFSWLYNVVLWYNAKEFERGIWTVLDIAAYWYRAGMQYVFYFFSSILVWFFGVYLFRNRTRIFQIIGVIILVPIIIYFTREIRYTIIDAMGRGRLRDTGEIWDWYIPLLFFYIQFGCYFAYQYFRENQRKLRLEGELRQAALKSELSAIKAQLNPHFLYNVFNTINASVPAELEKTRRMIAELSDIFRYQLKASQTDLVPLKEELDFLQKYLALEKERFGDRLKVIIDVPEALYKEKIPPMLLQPLVENSVKHGISSLIEGGSIRITIFRKGQKLKFEIADTGSGVSDESKLFDKGVGLTNTQLRLQKLYASQLHIFTNEHRGLTVTFSI